MARVPMPDWDIDSMGADELRSLVGRVDEHRAKYSSQRQRQRLHEFLRLAGIRLRILTATPRLKRFTPLWQQDFERLYSTLPAYCQWRRRYNVRAAVADGKKFRKHPPKEIR